MKPALLTFAAGAALAASVIAGSAGASSASVRLVHVTSPISAGRYATLVARVLPSRVTCSITVYYYSGPSHAAGLYSKPIGCWSRELDLEGRNEDDSGALADSSLVWRRRCAPDLVPDHMSRF